MDPQLLKEIDYLLRRAEARVWKKADAVVAKLYWDVGYCLREIKAEELQLASHRLGKELDVDARLFEIAYYFYKGNPIQKKALELAA